MAKARNEIEASPIGLRVRDKLTLIEKIEAGFPYRTLERLQEALAISGVEIADVVSITPRTLTRRKKEGRLRQEESERVLRVARLVEQATRFHDGDLDQARFWLKSPKRALGGRTPLEMARTEVGAREVERLLGRLEHGVYS
ncbi:MAG: type II RES/Xre toxin-antitoxin system antitoxin [Gemmatimonadota bacterium]